MKIVIAGAGAVGTHLARLLVQENHDITLIDEKPDRLETIGNLDIMTVVGSPLSIITLKDAGAGRADLFIAVTTDEAHNLTCCILSKKLGAKKTVARVDNPEFTQDAERAFFKEIGVESIIYPERLAGKEIMSLIKRSWIRFWWEVQNGALVILGVKVRAGASIIGDGQPIKAICGPDAPFHIVAIKRGTDTIIPGGDDRVEDGDVVYYMTTPDYVQHIREISGKEDYPDVRNAIIMGGSDTAIEAVQFMPDYMRIKIIEPDSQRCALLNQLIHNPNVIIIHGDASDIDLLEDENIQHAGAFAALTDSAEKNILACLEARRQGVKKTIAIVENTDYISMAESLDIGSIINKKNFAASHIYRMMLKRDVESVKSLTVASADVAELTATEGAKITRKKVRDLGLPSYVSLGGLIRNGKAILINGNTQIQAGDTVVAFCLTGYLKKLERFF